MESIKAVGFRQDAGIIGSTQWDRIGEGELEISDNSLKYGEISIPYDSISEAVLNENTKDGTYMTLYLNAGVERFMFNLILERDDIVEFPFAVVKTKGGPLEIKNSPLLKVFIFSLVLLVALVIIGLYVQ